MQNPLPFFKIKQARKQKMVFNVVKNARRNLNYMIYFF